jgi:hypothetical protein
VLKLLRLIPDMLIIAAASVLAVREHVVECCVGPTLLVDVVLCCGLQESWLF